MYQLFNCQELTLEYVNQVPIIYFIIGQIFSENYYLKVYLYQVRKNENEYLWVTEILRELELIVDSTEQPRERPTEYQKQKDYYSGKRSNHTFKCQYIITPKGTDIVDVLVGAPGPESDINLLRKQQKNFENKQKFQGDKADSGSRKNNHTKKEAKK